MPDGIRIRAARPAEFAACRMLLPPAANMGSGSEYLVAVQQQAPFLVGALCFASGMQATHGIRLRVLRAHRRQGVGSRLLARVEEMAVERKAEVLLAGTDAVTEPDAESFFTTHGFHRMGRLTRVRADLESATRIIYPLADRLFNRRPEYEKIVALSEAPRNAVVELYKAQLRRSPWTTPWGLLEEISAPRFARSPVLLSRGEVAGMLLYYVEGECGVIQARIVAPGFHGGAANLMLMASGLRTGSGLARAVEFDVPENNSDTEKLARRLGAQVIYTHDQYLRRLVPA